MQKRKNDVKARTTLLLAIPDEHQLRFTSQSSGSQIKFEDITQIDEDDMEEMDIKWNMALLSMRADIFWKKTGKKISIQGTDVAGFHKLKVECFNCHKMGHFARQYTRRARIAQSSALLPIADEPASPIGDDSQGDACSTVTSLVAG
nr:hypothetical protein [Tanacetum cinerariifolium]